MLSPSKAAHPGGFFRFTSRPSGLCRSNRCRVRFNFQPVSSFDPAARSLHASFKGKDSWTSHSDRADVSRSALACVAEQSLPRRSLASPRCSFQPCVDFTRSRDRAVRRVTDCQCESEGRPSTSPERAVRRGTGYNTRAPHPFSTRQRCSQRGTFSPTRVASAPVLAQASSSLSLARPIEKTLHANHLVRILVTRPRSRVAANSARPLPGQALAGGSPYTRNLVVFTLGRAGQKFDVSSRTEPTRNLE